MTMYDIGIRLTLFLVAINAFLIAGNSLPGVDLLKLSDESYLQLFIVNETDLNAINPATTEFFGVDIGSAPLVGTPLAFLNAGISAFFVLGKFIYSMAFGYSFTVDIITKSLGLDVIGYAIIVILMFIELYTIYVLLMKGTAVVRGGGAS